MPWPQPRAVRPPGPGRGAWPLSRQRRGGCARDPPLAGSHLFPRRRSRAMVVSAVADGATFSSLAARAAASRSAVGIRMDVFDVSVISLSSNWLIRSIASVASTCPMYHSSVGTPTEGVVFVDSRGHLRSLRHEILRSRSFLLCSNRNGGCVILRINTVFGSSGIRRQVA